MDAQPADSTQEVREGVACRACKYGDNCELRTAKQLTTQHCTIQLALADQILAYVRPIIEAEMKAQGWRQFDYERKLRYKWQDEIRWLRFIWLLREQKFRYAVKDALFYALNHHWKFRGDGACDVLLFEAN